MGGGDGHQFCDNRCPTLDYPSRPALSLRPYELFVGLRYTRAKRRTHFISFISTISMLGIALGIAALITVMSVMNGFEKEIRGRILGAAAHIQIAGEETGIKTIAKSLNEAHQACAGFKVEIALEITAGQGSNLGYKFEQMNQIFDATHQNERMRLCFDTEHAFAAGYDLRDDEGYERTFAELDEHIGLDRLVAFHINDSLKPFHSRIDRHEHIGKGYLGLDPFRRLVNDARFAGIPMCLETEPGPEMKDITADLQQLRQLLKSAN